jgi:hypothetical protein
MVGQSKVKLNKKVAGARNMPLAVYLRSDEIAAIEDFRYRARMPSQAAAVREWARFSVETAAKIKLTAYLSSMASCCVVCATLSV